MIETLAVLKFLGIGAFMGLTAGISPGPLLTLVISETLKHNRKEGVRIALSPLFTDIPIVLTSFFLFSRLSQFDSILGIVSFLGGIFIAYLAYETITIRELGINEPGMQVHTLKKGIIANFLSPHPYLFWVSVGAPLALKALETNILALVLFFLSFYVFLVGSKIGVAYVVSQTKVIFSNMLYLWVMRFLSIALFLFSVLFFFEGLKYFGLM
jgi:threonine/homoserine/homoserine lactone efflux protein